MRWEWVDPIQKSYVVGRAKGKEARVIPVPGWVWEAIFGMPKTISEWVFPAEDKAPHRPHYCKKVIHAVAEELGLGSISQHRLRSSFATLHSQAGTPLNEIQQMLGHKDITTTMVYLETSMEAKRKAQDALSQKLGLAQ